MPDSSPASVSPSDSPAAPELAPLPRWPALVAALAVGGIYTVLSPRLRVGPGWWLAVLIAVLLVPTALSRRAQMHRLNQFFGYLVAGAETLALLAAVANLVASLTHHTTHPTTLLRDAAVLYASNVLVFALWYWRLDAGGPHARDARPGHPTGAFLFPQMTLSKDDPNYQDDWSPDFVDYLFFAFNTSTALSPTDAPVLSRWAKCLMMIQACISITILSVLAGRAVNVL